MFMGPSGNFPACQWGKTAVMKYTRIEILNNILDARNEKETFSFPLSRRIHLFKKKDE
jgi:hypothetical protein